MPLDEKPSLPFGQKPEAAVRRIAIGMFANYPIRGGFVNSSRRGFAYQQPAGIMFRRC
jgi:hypothetical protein